MAFRYPASSGTTLLALVTVACPLGAQERELDEVALSLVNEARAEAELPALKPDETLASAAAGHAEDMLERDYYGHVGPDGDQPRDRYLSAGGNRWRIVAENIARCDGCETPPNADRIRAFQNGWMQSEGHRENILAPGVDSFGFGLASGEAEIYAVQLFAGPGTAPRAPEGATAERVGAEELRRAALNAVNSERQKADLAPLQPSGELDTLAEALADRAELEGDELSLPADPFELLPPDAGGWRELSMMAEACGGCGAYPAAGDGAHFGASLRQASEPRGSQGFTHFGFSLGADGNGRKVAVGVLGQR